MIKLYTENDLREAFRAGRVKGIYPSYMQGEMGEDEWIVYYTKEPIIEEKTVPITLGMIRMTCGWSRYCDVVKGANPYMLNEWTVEDCEIFNVKISDAKKLGLINENY